MKRKFTFLLVLLFSTVSTIYSQNVLRVLTTDWWDAEGVQGTIEEATFTVKPQGIYTEVGMILTLSAKETNYTNIEGLEIVLDFNLPEGSIIHDSWLWMLDDVTIVRADVLDISNATATYEDIVDRNMDPSLLYHKPNGGYQIRIFPLDGSHNRKIKITYLTPAVWSQEKVNTWLPLDILNTSKIPLETFKFVVFPDSNWGNPTIKNLEGITFEEGVLPGEGDVLLADIPANYINQPIQFSVDAPFNEDNVFVQKLNEGADDFYQIAYLPPSLPVSQDSKKVLFLVDHQDINTNIDRAELHKYLKDICRKNLDEDDYFNFIFSHPAGPIYLSENWISASSFVMENFFDLNTITIQDYTEIVELINTGIDFIKDNGEDGNIILLSNSNDNNLWNPTDELEEILLKMEGTEINMNIINYLSNNYYYSDIWNGPDEGWVYRNKEFYEQLTLATTGSLYDPFEGSSSLWENIQSVMNDIKSVDYNFDLYATLSSGFTFNRYHQNYLGQSQNINQPILQVGKYTGMFPLEIEFSAIHNGLFTYEDLEIQEDEIIQSDSLTSEIWYGHHIRDLESTAVASGNVQNIIDISIAERVLSDYTAFLALDLEQGGEVCIGCWDTDQIITVDNVEVVENEILLSATPNPFTDFCQIEIELPSEMNGEIILSVYDAFGKNMIEQKMEIPILGKLQWNWNGQNASGDPLAAGIYYLVVKSDNKMRTLKLNLVR